MIRVRRLLPLLQEAHDILLTGHKEPDGDSIGAIMGLYHVLTAKGKTVTCLVDGAIPSRLQGLDPEGCIKNVQIWDGSDEAKRFSHVVACDSSAPERLGGCAMYLKEAQVINVDHHSDNTYFGHFDFVFPQASSTCEILALALEGQHYIPRSACEALTAGILYDTGGLQHPNVTAFSLEFLSRCMDRGVDLSALQKSLFASLSKEAFQALNLALSRAQFDAEERLVWTVLEGDEETIQASSQKTINELMAIEGVEVAVLLIPRGREVKISLRCHTDFPLHHLAAQWGGGGHQKAAGATIKMGLQSARNKIISQVVEGIHEWDSQSS